MLPDDSKNITKGGGVLAIPGGMCHWNVPIRMQGLSKEGHETIETEEQRGGALDSSIKLVPAKAGSNHEKARSW